jgi:hypothetical protein
VHKRPRSLLTLVSDDSASKRSNCEDLEAEHGDSGNVVGSGNVVECSWSSDDRAGLGIGLSAVVEKGGVWELVEVFICSWGRGRARRSRDCGRQKLTPATGVISDKAETVGYKRKVNVNGSAGAEGAWVLCLFMYLGQAHPCHRLVYSERHCGRANASSL